MQYSHYYNKTYEQYLNELGEAGNVRQVLHPIVHVDGLPLLRLDEVVYFETGEVGITVGLSESFSEILVLSKNPVPPGTQTARTDRLISIPLRSDILGKALDPLGVPLAKTPIQGEIEEFRTVHSTPLHIGMRKAINRPFYTGVSIVDLMIPLGQGQRELVIGNRKTGKTTFLLQTLLTQAQLGTICIYAAIGQKAQDIQYLQDFLVKHSIAENTVIVCSGSADPTGMIFLTPYTAMTIAEYFRDKGHNSLIILDDLTTHAKVYREISLLGKSFPGRSSYPADMFYAHARLLERAGNFGSGEEERSITCLPVAATTEGNLSGYIQTSLMSITDGHIFLDEKLFTGGRRPGINQNLSVTRTGRQTQSLVRWGINRELNTFLDWVEKTKSVAHFGAELNTGITSIMQMAEKIETFFNQHTDTVLPINVQILLFSLIWLGEWQNADRASLNMNITTLAERYRDDSAYQLSVDTFIENAKDFNSLLVELGKSKEKYLPH